MAESLGKCSIPGCGKEAGALYPLLPGKPCFCHEHHNPKNAGPFGCDFTGPDDFDIPFGDDDVPFHTRIPKYQKLDRKVFVWTDREGVRHKLKDIDDTYLTNIINFLVQGKGQVSGDSGTRRNDVINFLREEQTYRKKLKEG